MSMVTINVQRLSTVPIRAAVITVDGVEIAADLILGTRLLTIRWVVRCDFDGHGVTIVSCADADTDGRFDDIVEKAIGMFCARYNWDGVGRVTYSDPTTAHAGLVFHHP